MEHIWAYIYTYIVSLARKCCIMEGGPCAFWKSCIFFKYWRWWAVQAFKITKFARWRDFNALRRSHVSSTWLVEWLHPKSNIVYRGDCSTKGGRTIRTVSNFDFHFRDHKLCILKMFWNRCVRRCLNFTFWKYHGLTLRNNKVIRTQATGSMDRKFRNHDIFQNIDAGEGFRRLNSRNSFAGAMSMPCGAPTYHSHDSLDWLHPKSNIVCMGRLLHKLDLYNLCVFDLWARFSISKTM